MKHELKIIYPNGNIDYREFESFEEMQKFAIAMEDCGCITYAIL